MENLFIVLWSIAHPVKALKKTYSEKCWIAFVLLSVLYLALTVLVILLFLRLFAFLSGAIARTYNGNKQEIDFGIFVLMGFAALIYYLRQRRAPKITPQPATVDTDAEQKAAERTYTNIAEVILPVIQKACHIFPFLSPAQASEMFTPARARKNLDIWYYRYAVVKNGEPDVATTKRFLNDELTRFLCNREAHGLASNTVFIQGVEYPALIVADVRDVGTYFEINVVVTTDKILRHLNYRQASTLGTQGNEINVDDDQFI